MKQKVIRFNNIKPYWIREEAGERMHFETVENTVVVRYVSDVIITYN